MPFLIELLTLRQDKTYLLILEWEGVCDSVRFVLMQQRGITEALTTDRHFEQEGFNRLLRLES